MLLRNFFKVIIFIVVVFLQWNNLAVSQTQNLNQDFRPFTDLTLEISSTEETLVPLKPIPITIKQSNRTEQPILGYNSIGFDKSRIYLYVQKVGSNERKLIDSLTTISGFIEINNSEVPPGNSCEAKEWVTLGLKKYFPQPGSYELQVALQNADRTQIIESNKIVINIQEPTGRDREVYNLINNSSAVDYLFSGAEFVKNKNLLETIATRFQNSNYARSTFYVLGEKHYQRNQRPQALVYFLRLENDNGFIFAEKVRKYLASIRQEIPIEQLEDN